MNFDYKQCKEDVTNLFNLISGRYAQDEEVISLMKITYDKYFSGDTIQEEIMNEDNNDDIVMTIPRKVKTEEEKLLLIEQKVRSSFIERDTQHENFSTATQKECIKSILIIDKVI